MQEWAMNPEGFRVGAGTRDSEEQSSICHALVEACGAKHPDPRCYELWCPVLGDYVHSDLVYAILIFPRRL